METGLPVKEIMTHDPIAVNINTKISEAARTMSELDVGSIIVMEGNNPVGILTEHDMVKKIISMNKVPDSLTLKSVMTTPLITIDADEDVLRAKDLMLKLHIRRIPIVKDKKLVGLVTDTDLVSVSIEMGNILSELISMHRERTIGNDSEIPEMISRGVCESCGRYYDNLDYLNGSLMCESCRETE
ncbi:MAG: CBS domain-containing protein [ANME-2 cluster archaeon]|nr:CBS domain-containing protein [ANME-2 cluster archaeon]